MRSRPKKGTPADGKPGETPEVELFRVKLAAILSGSEVPPASAPENAPDPVAFGFQFGCAAGVFPGGAIILERMLRKPHKADRGADLRKLEQLEHRRAQAWRSGLGRSREEVAFGLVAALTTGRINVEIESKDHERIARDVIQGWKELQKIMKWAERRGDTASLDDCRVLSQVLETYFPDEDRLRRRAGRRDKKSRNGAGLRERLMAPALNDYLTMALGPRDLAGRNDQWRPGLIADLLWEMTGLEIDAKQVSRWISEHEKYVENQSYTWLYCLIGP